MDPKSIAELKKKSFSYFHCKNNKNDGIRHLLNAASIALFMLCVQYYQHYICLTRLGRYLVQKPNMETKKVTHILDGAIANKKKRKRKKKKL